MQFGYPRGARRRRPRGPRARRPSRGPRRRGRTCARELGRASFFPISRPRRFRGLRGRDRPGGGASRTRPRQRGLDLPRLNSASGVGRRASGGGGRRAASGHRWFSRRRTAGVVRSKDVAKPGLTSARPRATRRLAVTRRRRGPARPQRATRPSRRRRRRRPPRFAARPRPRRPALASRRHARRSRRPDAKMQTGPGDAAAGRGGANRLWRVAALARVARRARASIDRTEQRAAAGRAVVKGQVAAPPRSAARIFRETPPGASDPTRPPPMN